MDNQNENIDKDFQQAFEDFSLEIEPQVWEDIREELHPQKEKKKIFWFWPASVAASLLVGMLFFFNGNQEEQLVQSIAEIIEVEEVEEEVVVNDSLSNNNEKEMIEHTNALEKENGLVEQEPLEIKKEKINVFVAEKRPVIEESQSENFNIIEEEKETLLGDALESIIVDSISVEEEFDEPNVLVAQEKDSVADQKSNHKEPSLTVPIEYDFTSKESKWLLAANFNGNGNTTLNKNDAVASNGVDFASDEEMVDLASDDLYSESDKGIQESVGASNNYTRVTKVITSLHGDYQLNQQTYFGIGLAYAFQSILDNSSGSTIGVNSIGIPVSARCNFVQTKKHNLYVNGAVMYEVLLDAPYAFSNPWTFNAALGGDKIILKQWQAFAQVGLSYELLNILDRPTIPLLQIGLRYRFQK